MTGHVCREGPGAIAADEIWHRRPKWGEHPGKFYIIDDATLTELGTTVPINKFAMKDEGKTHGRIY